MAAPLDVTDADAVDELAQRAAARFGRIDVWVNNAAVTAFGALHAVPMRDHRRVIETNLFGYIHGARAAFQHFLPQRHGLLINVASIDSRLSQPYMSAYVASKHAVRGLGMSLRQELWLEGYHDVHVCTVMPATIDTPLFQHAANYSGRAVDAMPPVYEAQRGARTILRLVKKPRREVFVGHSGRLFNAQHQLAPAFTERFMARLSDRFQLSRKKRATPTAGNLLSRWLRGERSAGTGCGKIGDCCPDRSWARASLAYPRWHGFFLHGTRPRAPRSRSQGASSGTHREYSWISPCSRQNCSVSACSPRLNKTAV